MRVQDRGRNLQDQIQKIIILENVLQCYGLQAHASRLARVPVDASLCADSLI